MAMVGGICLRSAKEMDSLESNILNLLVLSSFTGVLINLMHQIAFQYHYVSIDNLADISHTLG